MGGDVYIVTSQYKTLCTTVNCIPQDGRTALYQASFNGHHKVVDLLTNAGAAVDVQDEVNMDVIIALIVFGLVGLCIDLSLDPSYSLTTHTGCMHPAVI